MGDGAYIGIVPVPMSKEDERTIALLEKLPIVATPIYSAFCIIAAALLFYRNRLKKPLVELRTASEKIANNDLDFSIDYDNNDELGQLCASFEIMRTTLADNFSKMWRQVEEMCIRDSLKIQRMMRAGSNCAMLLCWVIISINS